MRRAYRPRHALVYVFTCKPHLTYRYWSWSRYLMTCRSVLWWTDWSLGPKWRGHFGPRLLWSSVISVLKKGTEMTEYRSDQGPKWM